MEAPGRHGGGQRFSGAVRPAQAAVGVRMRTDQQPDAVPRHEPDQRQTIGDALRSPDNRLRKLAEAKKDDRKLVEDIYLTVLSRPPSEGIGGRRLQGGLRPVRSGPGPGLGA